jgi:hypothetical protein
VSLIRIRRPGGWSRADELCALGNLNCVWLIGGERAVKVDGVWIVNGEHGEYRYETPEALLACWELD